MPGQRRLDEIGRAVQARLDRACPCATQRLGRQFGERRFNRQRGIERVGAILARHRHQHAGPAHDQRIARFAALRLRRTAGNIADPHRGVPAPDASIGARARLAIGNHEARCARRDHARAALGVSDKAAAAHRSSPTLHGGGDITERDAARQHRRRGGPATSSRRSSPPKMMARATPGTASRRGPHPSIAP